MFKKKQYQLSLCFAAAFFAASFAVADEETAQKSNANQVQIEAGKKLFESICSHCHKTNYDESSLGAPGLQGVLERHEIAWLDKWIKSPETFARTDVTARDLIDSNRFGLSMPTYPAMQDDANRKAIIEYLKTLK